MTDTEKAALYARIDELCQEVEYDRQTSRSRLERIDQLKDENVKLWEYVAWLEEEVIERGYVPSQTKTWLNAKRFELGLEVPS